MKISRSSIRLSFGINFPCGTLRSSGGSQEYCIDLAVVIKEATERITVTNYVNTEQPLLTPCWKFERALCSSENLLQCIIVIWVVLLSYTNFNEYHTLTPTLRWHLAVE